MMTDPDLTGRRVLVVEDEYLLAADLCDTFEMAGADIVGPAPSLKAAQKLVEDQSHIDYAVLDVNLDGQSVYPVADALAERGVPFAFVTGYDAGTIPSRFDGVTRVEKPVEPTEVVRTVCQGMDISVR